MSDKESSAADKAYCVSFTAAIIAAGLALVVIALRARFPYELEWMTGSVLDHIDRVRAGKPVYVAPSGEWTPFLYPPAFYWLCSLLPKTNPEFLGPRLVALAGTGVASVGAYLITRRLSGSKRDSLLAPLLFLSTFAFVSHWFDIERVDSWFVAFTAIACIALFRLPGAIGGAVGGTLLALSCFFKQPGVLFFASASAIFAVRREWRTLGAFATSFVAVFGGLFLLLQHQTDGWFAYYVYKLPGGHGIDKKLITLFLVVDQSQAFLFTTATFVAFARWLPFRKLGFSFGEDERDKHIFVAFLGAAWAASASGRMHVGGFPNVNLFWLFFAAIALAIFVGQIDRELVAAKKSLHSYALNGLLALQCLRFLEDPSQSVPGKQSFAHAEYLRRVVHEYESGGKEVFLLTEGHVTKAPHAHSAAIVDIYRSGVTIAPLNEDFRKQRFGAVIIGDVAELDYRYVLGEAFDRELTMLRPAAENYAVTKYLEPGPFHVVGHKINPTWLLTPRATPLSGMTLDALDETLRNEAAAALAATSARKLEQVKRGQTTKDTYLD